MLVFCTNHARKRYIQYTGIIRTKKHIASIVKRHLAAALYTGIGNHEIDNKANSLHIHIDQDITAVVTANRSGPGWSIVTFEKNRL